MVQLLHIKVSALIKTSLLCVSWLFQIDIQAKTDPGVQLSADRTLLADSSLMLLGFYFISKQTRQRLTAGENLFKQLLFKFHMVGPLAGSLSVRLVFVIFT